MLFVFLVLSLLSSVTQNCLFNTVSKNDLSTDNHIYYFNSYVSLVCVVLFGILLFQGKLSLFTVLLGVAYGATTAFRNVYYMQALANGPMNITLLITTSSMIIPTMSGVFFGEKFSIAKFAAVFFLVSFIYVSLKKDDGSKINKKWIIFAALTFLTQGIVGVLQKVHQMSEYRSEAAGFLFVAFILAYIYNKVRVKGNVKTLSFGKKNALYAFMCGLCTFCVNYVNLKLSGMMPSQLFFPLVNGGAMVLSQVMSIVVFKETLSKKQLIGLIGGICSLIAICII